MDDFSYVRSTKKQGVVKCIYWDLPQYGFGLTKSFFIWLISNTGLTQIIAIYSSSIYAVCYYIPRQSFTMLRAITKCKSVSLIN
jgi:hypothetical protein